MASRYEKEIGLDRSITRRDFIQGSGLLIGSAFAAPGIAQARQEYGFDVGSDWYGPGGIGDYQLSHGNTPELVRVAHEIRAGDYDRPALGLADVSETYDMVIVGGGFAGLGAAHHFHRLNPAGRALLLDNHPIFGGEAKRNEFEVDGYHLVGPQGSNDFAIQPETGDPGDYFTALNLPREFEFAEPLGDAAGMRIPLDNYDYMHWHHDTYDVAHYFTGAGQRWVKDTWNAGLEATPWSEEIRNGFRRLRQTDMPNDGKSDAWLDSMTLEAFYTNELGLPKAVSAYYDPIMASIAGLGCDALSAYWGKYFSFPGFTKPENLTGDPLLSFPGGNAGIARHFVKSLIPGSFDGDAFEDVINGQLRFDELDKASNAVRIRLNATAVRVEHVNDKEVLVTYVKDGETLAVRARGVVMASGGWVNRRIVRDLPQEHQDAYARFLHAPVLVANVALNNWRFLARLGVAAAIWSGGFGFTCNIRRPMVVGGESQPLDPDKPVVLTFYAPIHKPGLPAAQQGIVARAEMLSTSFADYERQIREQMSAMFASGGFDAARDIAGIILNRWGHAYVAPTPGFLFGTDDQPAPPDVIRQPFGRIAFGHSELRGHQYWTGAAGEGRRAVESLLDQYF